MSLNLCLLQSLCRLRIQINQNLTATRRNNGYSLKVIKRVEGEYVNLLYIDNILYKMYVNINEKYYLCSVKS